MSDVVKLILVEFLSRALAGVVLVLKLSQAFWQEWCKS